MARDGCSRNGGSILDRRGERGAQSPARLRDMARRVREDWEAFGAVQRAEGAPKTNHRTERAIGRMRARTVCGKPIAAWDGSRTDAERLWERVASVEQRGGMSLILM